ncbi:MAG: AI-2E family transporter [Thermoleophilaceae bacterium]
MGGNEIPTPRAVARTVLIAVLVIVSLYVLYLLRKPIGWLLIAAFLAIALSGPVDLLHRRMRRGAAITIVYVGLLLVPVAIGAVVLPPIVNGVDELARDAPTYANDVSDFVQGNGRLRNLNEDYNVTDNLEQEAGKLPGRLGNAASVLSDVGLGIVNSVFALVTILILTAFMLGSGWGWIRAGLRYLPEERARRIQRVLQRSAGAVGSYVAGALFQALVAGVLSFAVLTILGIPFAAPLAVLIFFVDLIPLVGATVGAVIVGVVTVFSDFPVDTIVWVVWAIVYQQIENNLIQPQIQKRAVDINPFLVIVSVLFGGTLLGVVGALVAVPAAASIQIALREYADLRGIGPRTEEPSTTEPPAPAPEPA